MLVPLATLAPRDHLVSLEREVTPAPPEKPDGQVLKDQLDSLDPLENRYDGAKFVKKLTKVFRFTVFSLEIHVQFMDFGKFTALIAY